jgi:hypothetical protein
LAPTRLLKVVAVGQPICLRVVLLQIVLLLVMLLLALHQKSQPEYTLAAKRTLFVWFVPLGLVAAPHLHTAAIPHMRLPKHLRPPPTLTHTHAPATDARARSCSLPAPYLRLHPHPRPLPSHVCTLVRARSLYLPPLTLPRPPHTARACTSCICIAGDGRVGISLSISYGRFWLCTGALAR